MDIDLLAKMVKEVVMDHDVVTLPGMGSFVAELVPASFADRGYTILPPYRRLYFSPKQGDDRLLVELYARSNEVPEADAARILEEFLLEMKEVLKERKTLVLTGLGRLRATRENHFFFVADEDLDIYPAGFGLQPISLKTHEETPEEVAAVVSSLAQILTPAEEAPAEAAVPAGIPGAGTEEVPEVSAEEIPEEAPAESPEETPLEPVVGMPSEVPAETQENTAVAPQETPGDVPQESAGEVSQGSAGEPALENTGESVPEVSLKEKKNRKGWKVFWRILLWLFIIALVAAVALAVVGRLAPEWLDTFLYSPEELEILHRNGSS